MAATDTFPSFSEICRTARDTERRLLAATPSQISGVLHPGEGAAIFPKEFDEYTYSLLLSEAHKVERKLFAASYAGTLTGQGAPGAVPPQIDERKMELEAREVSDYEIGSQPEQKKESMAGRFSRFSGLKMPFGKKEEAPRQPSKAPQYPQQQAIPAEDEQIPAEVLLARRERMMREEMQKSPAGAGTPEEGMQPVSEEEKIAERRRGLVPEEAEDEELEKEAPLPAMDEEEQFEKSAPLSTEPTSKLGASSKISPRLREMIEQKLKREEEKERAERAASPKIAPPVEEEEKEEEPAEQAEKEAASGEEGGEEEKIYMSARERLLARLQKQKGAIAPAEEDEGEEKPAAKSKMDLGEEESEKEEEEEKEKPLAKAKREVREEQEEGEKEGKEKPASPSLRAASPFSQRGGMQIKPIFAEEVGSKKEEEPAIDQEKEEENEGAGRGQKSEDEESDERMTRIQRIIDELSPDKLKAKMEEEPEEKPKLKRMKEEEGEEPGEKIPVRIPVSKKQLPQKKLPAAAKGAKGKVLPKEVGKKPASRVLPQKKSAEKVLPQKKAAKVEQEEAPEEEETPPQKIPARVLPTRPVKPSVQSVSPKIQQPQEGAKPRIQEASPPASTTSPKLRILPGLGKMPAPKTYVPPVRPRAAAPEEEDVRSADAERIRHRAALDAEKEPEEEKESKEPGEEQEKTEEAAQKEAPPKKMEQAPSQKPKPTIALPKPQLTSAERMLQARPKKQVLDEPVEEPPSPEMVEEDKRVKQRAEKLQQFARKPHDLAGEAALPAEEDELAVPKPLTAEEEIPRPQDYAQAKEKLKYREQQDEITQNARKENEEMLESYAKENLTWLYEIYKMGGIAREAFLQKVQEKIDEEKGGIAPGAAEPEPENPALTNLEKQVEKKKKGWPF